MYLYKSEPVKLHWNVNSCQSKITVKYLLKTFGKQTQELSDKKHELWKILETGSIAVVVDFERELDKLQWQPFKTVLET